MIISKVNLNLLVAFEALVAEQNVTKAARRLGVTQSAMSNLLNQLRKVFKDELLIRSAHGMIPTDRAIALLARVRKVIEDANSIFAGESSFDPKTSKRVFTIGMTDYAQHLFMTHLLKIIKKEAPNAEVVILLISDLKTTIPLAAGLCDMAIFSVPQGAIVSTSPNLKQDLLYTDTRLYCMAGKNNPVLKSKLTMSRYLAAEHVLIDDKDMGLKQGITDIVLKRMGKRRKVLLTLPNYSVIPQVLSATDYIMTVTGYLAKEISQHVNVNIQPAPIKFSIDCYQVWHKQNQDNPSHIWLRKLSKQVVKDVIKDLSGKA